MYREMRRKDRMLSNEAMISIMTSALYGVLSTVDDKGIPYGVPLNFVFDGDCIYFHCAQEGQKLDNITSNSTVSFCVVSDVETLAEKFSSNYKSVIAFGEVEEIVDEDKKKAALMLLVKKFSSAFMESGRQYVHKSSTNTAVFKIKVKHMTAKGRQ